MRVVIQVGRQIAKLRTHELLMVLSSFRGIGNDLGFQVSAGSPSSKLQQVAAQAVRKALPNMGPQALAAAACALEGMGSLDKGECSSQKSSRFAFHLVITLAAAACALEGMGCLDKGERNQWCRRHDLHLTSHDLSVITLAAAACALEGMGSLDKDRQQTFSCW